MTKLGKQMINLVSCVQEGSIPQACVPDALTAFTSLVLIKDKGYFQESDQPSVPFSMNHVLTVGHGGVVKLH